MSSSSLRRLMYVSTSNVGHDTDELAKIITLSRQNNALDGITGLLWTDGLRFAQVLEGDPAGLIELMDRIYSDSRHTSIKIAYDRPVHERAFGDWSMAQPATDPQMYPFEQLVQRSLYNLATSLAVAFDEVIRGARRSWGREITL